MSIEFTPHALYNLLPYITDNWNSSLFQHVVIYFKSINNY